MHFPDPLQVPEQQSAFAAQVAPVSRQQRHSPLALVYLQVEFAESQQSMSDPHEPPGMAQLQSPPLHTPSLQQSSDDVQLDPARRQQAL